MTPSSPAPSLLLLSLLLVLPSLTHARETEPEEPESTTQPRSPAVPPARGAAGRAARWPTSAPGAISAAETTAAMAQAERLLRQLDAQELSAREVQRAALRRAQLDPALVASWLSRVRRAALFPMLRAGVARELRRYDSYLSTADPRQDARADLLFEVSATWHLDRLVFNRDEIRAGREGVRAARARSELLLFVTRLHYERRALQIELAVSPPADLEGAVAKRLRLAELTTLLEGLTGRKFARRRIPR